MLHISLNSLLIKTNNNTIKFAINTHQHRHTLLRPVQVRLGPTELHHPECQWNVLLLGQFFHLGFVHTCVEHHGGVVH